METIKKSVGFSLSLTQTFMLTEQNLNQKSIHWSQIMWRLWAKALGEKAHKKDQVADKVAIIRTVIFISYLITNCFIIGGVIKHWNDEPVQIYIETSPDTRFNNTMVRI